MAAVRMDVLNNAGSGKVNTTIHAQQARFAKAQKELFFNTLAASLTTMNVVGLFNPLDCLRIRWQVATKTPGQNILSFGKNIIRTEGLMRGLWLPGLPANMTSIFFSAGVRMGFYPYIRDYLVLHSNKREKTPTLMFTAGFGAGVLGYVMIAPIFQVKTLLQVQAQVNSEGSSASLTQTPYRNTRTTFAFLYQTGLQGLFRGATPLIIRGASLSAGQQLGYDYTKTTSKKHDWMEDGPALHIVASVVAALSSTLLSAPMDLVMTRYQSAPQLGIHYRSVFHCVSMLYRTEGAGVFFRGWTAYFARVCPLFIINLPIYEQVRKHVFKLGYLD